MTQPNAQNRLIGFLERIERLEAERKLLAQDIAEIKGEAKAAGFDLKVIGQMLKERRMDPDALEEFHALCELYRGAIGMLRGTPLGTAARKQLARGMGGETPSGQDDPAAAEAAAQMSRGDAPADEPLPPPTPEDIEGAKVQGAAAHAAGESVTRNPWPAADARRAAWDEGWCGAAGSDGMDIPDAWRRKPKPAKKGAGA